ncbi:hypothetical protein PENSPDRAFT_286724 [Peniophora sp. CONT]|nr:hypothetical protein PENSPDRAFT_286724 [Peniophora sp. CONT]
MAHSPLSPTEPMGIIISLLNAASPDWPLAGLHPSESDIVLFDKRDIAPTQRWSATLRPCTALAAIDFRVKDVHARQRMLVDGTGKEVCRFILVDKIVTMKPRVVEPGVYVQAVSKDGIKVDGQACEVEPPQVDFPFVELHSGVTELKARVASDCGSEWWNTFRYEEAVSDTALEMRHDLR